MKNLIFVALAIIVAGAFSIVGAQEPTTGSPPPIGDNATPVDNSIKLRSVELERIKREAEKTAVLRREDGKELKFSIVKEDFEGIQKEQMLIVDAYTKSREINYQQISKSSNKITEMAVRLRANVFAPEGSENKDEGDAGVAEAANPFVGKSVRDLIVALDNVIGAVVSNPMWQKLAVIDPETSSVVEANLLDVINASTALWLESNKMSSK
ncbi:MAG: hypothetical protein OEM82_08000 [Acidobacteriota bacterium]|nr:hypothetical protein [Acidobacteriota bacterium]MDH3528371.1 hypothetical protein [Acidobacteriota bacterium]